MNIDKPLMLVVDTSVLLHKLHQSTPVAHNDPQFESILKANLVWLTSCEWLGEHKDRVKSVVFVKDTKPYWRTEWLLDLENVIDIPRKTKVKQKLSTEVKGLLAKGLPALLSDELETISEAHDKLTIKYKGGRKLPDYSFKKLRKLIYGYLDNMAGVHALESTGFEADDMAAALVQTNRDNGSPWDLLLLTVDTDWLGLGGDDVTWVCMSGFEPVVRDHIDIVNQWAEKRLKATLVAHRDIWDIKGVQGDASDNLPASAGVLLPVIDLLNPPVEYRYWLKAPQRIANTFVYQGLPHNSQQAAKARQHLKLNGLFPVVKYLPDQDPYRNVHPLLIPLMLNNIHSVPDPNEVLQTSSSHPF